jgi:hypothetical protein
MEKKNKSKRRSSPELMASTARHLQAPSKVRFPPSNVPPEKRICGAVEVEVTVLDVVAPTLARTMAKQGYWEGGSAEESSRE